MKTHFAVIHNGIVIGSRSSDSRHVDGAGKFGPYTHAACVDDRNEHGAGSVGVLTYHGSLAAAVDSARTWGNRGRRTMVLPVVVTAKRLAVGFTVDFQEGGAR